MEMDDIRTNPPLNEKVIDGRLRNLAPDRPVVAIGVRLAEALGATVGSSISLISPQGQVTPFGTAPRIVSYEVGAIFEVGVYDYDKAFVIMPTEQAQTLLMLRSEEHTSELQSLMRISYAVYCLKKKKQYIKQFNSYRINT